MKICGSNHWPIIINVDGISGHEVKEKIFLFDKFYNSLNSISIGDNLDEFLSKLKSMKNDYTIKVRPNNKYVPKPWWNSELSRLFRIRNAARKKYYVTHSFEDCENLIRAEDDLKKYIRKRKIEHFKQLVDELSYTKDIKRFWYIINRLKKYGQEKLIRNSWEESDNRKFLELIGNFDIVAFESSSSEHESDNDIQTPPVLDFNKFLNFIRNRNPDSACGVDGINYRMLCVLPQGELRKIFNWISDIWNNLNIPESWRKIRICPVPKRGRDISFIVNHRPICLLSVLLKSLEYLIKVFFGGFH